MSMAGVNRSEALMRTGYVLLWVLAWVLAQAAAMIWLTPTAAEMDRTQARCDPFEVPARAFGAPDPCTERWMK